MHKYQYILSGVNLKLTTICPLNEGRILWFDELNRCEQWTRRSRLERLRSRGEEAYRTKYNKTGMVQSVTARMCCKQSILLRWRGERRLRANTTLPWRRDVTSLLRHATSQLAPPALQARYSNWISTRRRYATVHVIPAGRKVNILARK